MLEFHWVLLRTQAFIDMLGDEHAAVHAARTAHGNDQLALALLDILRHEEIDHAVKTLDEFLRGQIEFTKKLCGKAGNAQMEVTGDNVCPRCHSGVLTQRKGKNGLFWGCSNYPKCRMTCNDKDGKPDFEDAKARMARTVRTSAPAAVSASQLARQSGASGYKPRQVAPAVYAQSDSGPSAQDRADLNSLFAAADYEATVQMGHPFCFKDIWPDTNALFANSYILKEYIGYWGYRLLR